MSERINAIPASSFVLRRTAMAIGIGYAILFLALQAPAGADATTSTPPARSVPVYLYPTNTTGTRGCAPASSDDLSTIYNQIKAHAPNISASYSAPTPPENPNQAITAAEALKPAVYGAIIASGCRTDDGLEAWINATVIIRDKTGAVIQKAPGTTVTGFVVAPGATLKAGETALYGASWSQLYPSSVPIYLYPTRSVGTTTCHRPTPDDLTAVYNMIVSNAPNLGAVYYRPAVPSDPIANASTTAEISPAPGATVIADVCRNGLVVTASVTGYVLQRDNTGKVTQIAPGNTLTGTIDSLEANNWATLYVDPTYSGVGYLPISGDSADTINNYVEHALPFDITVISDVKTATGLCTSTGNSMLIVGQGSLVTQVLDPFRLIVGAAGFTLTSPTPWVTAEKFGLAAIGLALVPAKQSIAVDIFDCYDGGLYRMVDKIKNSDGTENADTEKYLPTLHVNGHSRRYGWGTSDPAAARKVLDDAVYDLEWQITCIVYNRMIATTAITNMRQANSPYPLPRAPVGSPYEQPPCQQYFDRIGWSPLYDPVIAPTNRTRLKSNAITTHLVGP